MKKLLVKIGMFLFTHVRKLKPVIRTVVEEVQIAMKDGVITAEERKDVAEETILSLAESYGIELNWIQRIIVSKAIDYVAKKLPKTMKKDITLPTLKEARSATRQVAEYKEKQRNNNFAK